MPSPQRIAILIAAVASTLALTAPLAQADEFTAETYPVMVTGSKDEGNVATIGTTAGTVNATSLTYTGTISGNGTSMSLAPTFSGLSAFGFPAVVHMNGCSFVFQVAGGDSTHGTMAISCPGSSEITVTALSGPTLKCTLHIPPQSDIGGTVTYANLGSGQTREITVNANLTDIDYSHTVGSGIGACPSGSGTNGTFAFKSILTGEVHGSSGHIGIFLSIA